MGIDFASYQLFTGNSGAKEVHNHLLTHFPELVVKNGFQSVAQSEEADRIIVIGPPGRWIWIYDSYAGGNQSSQSLRKRISDCFI